jgi:hypothetical protein
MAGDEGQSQQKKQTDAEREKSLNELKAMRERRLGTTGQPAPASAPSQQQQKPAPAPVPQKKVQPESVDLSVPRKEDDDAAIAAVRASRMQAEAYHDVTVLRKRAQVHQHKAAKFHTKNKNCEAKAQKAITKAVAFRNKAEGGREKAKDFEARERDFEKDLKASATGEGAMEPEKIRLKMSKLEKKIASLQERARKFEAKAALQNERAANYRSKAAFNLEQAKIHEAEVKNFTKRADNLEKADQMG